MGARSSEFGGRCAPAYSWIFMNISWGVSLFLSWHDNASFPMKTFLHAILWKFQMLELTLNYLSFKRFIFRKIFFLCPCHHRVFQPCWKESFQAVEMEGQEDFSCPWETAVVYKFISEDGRGERCASRVSTDTAGPSSLLLCQHDSFATAFPSFYRALELKNSVMSLSLSFDRIWTKGLDYLES